MLRLMRSPTKPSKKLFVKNVAFMFIFRAQSPKSNH